MNYTTPKQNTIYARNITKHHIIILIGTDPISELLWLATQSWKKTGFSKYLERIVALDIFLIKCDVVTFKEKAESTSIIIFRIQL